MQTTNATAPSVPLTQKDGLAYMRQQLLQSAGTGNDNKAWSQANSLSTVASLRFTVGKGNGDGMAYGLHELWYMYYHGSKSIDAGHPAQDRLAMQVVRLQAQGALSHPYEAVSGDDGDSNSATEIATTSGGVVWTDLPFFVPDMMDLWIQNGPSLSAEHRVNFSHFLAQLAAAGLVKDKLCSIALTVLRDTLETPRSLVSEERGHKEDKKDEKEDGDDENTKTMADLTIQDLLPIAQVWLQHAGTKIIQLADRQWKDCHENAGAIGPLYRDDVATALKTASYSPERWIFWLRRLEAIAHDANNLRPEQNIAGLVEQTTKAMDTMLNSLHESHSIVRSTFEALPPDATVQHKNPTWELIGTVFSL